MVLARRQWRRLDVTDLDGSWPAVLARLMVIVSAAQVGAAAAGAAYVAQALQEIGQETAAAGTVAAGAFGGVASDGRPLASLLYSAVVQTRTAAAGRTPLLDAGDQGRRVLDMIVRTQVADAGREAAGVAITARPNIGWTRYVSPPCCQRCAVLAGRWFKWNDGFQRHPRCDCRHVPTGQEGSRHLASKVDPGQVRDLTQAQRKAISDGADMNQVINAHRAGARAADGMTTTAGATRKGTAGQRLKGRARLTPEGIYKVSATRDEAIERLIANGYII